MSLKRQGYQRSAGKIRMPKAKVAASSKIDKQQEKEIKALVKAVTAIKPEMKYKTTAGTSVTVTASLRVAAPTTTVLNGLVQGTTNVSRIGEKVNFKTIDLRFRLITNSTLTTEASVRIMLVKERTALGSAPSLQGILGSATPNTWSTRNVTDRDPNRYHIYYDKVFYMSPGSWSLNGTGTSTFYNPARPSIILGSIVKKLDFVTDYSRSNAGDETDMDANCLALVAITDHGVASAMTLSYEMNLGFQDV